jgi:hypothetical protein
VKKSKTIFLCLLCFFGCSKQRSACLYEIPEGFTGWVLIEFGRSNCPPLSTKHGKSVVPIGSNGRYCTSSDLEDGWAKDTYFFVGKSRSEIQATGWGGGGLIWGGSTGREQQQGKPDTVYENFFVGTEDQFNHAGEQPRPE